MVFLRGLKVLLSQQPALCLDSLRGVPWQEGASELTPITTQDATLQPHANL